MRTIEEEKKVQSTGWLYFKFAGGLAFLFCMLLWNNHHQFVAAALGIVCLVVAAHQWAGIAEKFAGRLEAITYMQQVESIYCVSVDEYDTEVSDVCRRTIDLLKKYNTHEVRVHLIMFRRPFIYTYFTSKKGMEVQSRFERQGIVVNESFEDFQAFATQWCLEERDKRRRELDGIKESRWTEEYIYHQDFNSNGKASQN